VRKRERQYHPKHKLKYSPTNLHHSKMDEIAAKQRQREEEAEARLRAKRAGLPEPSRTESEVRTAPRLNLAPRTGGGPSWRERQAAKEASGGAAPEAPKAEPEPPRRTGGYVPPHARGGSDAAPPAGNRYVPPSQRSSQPPSRTQTPPTSSPKPEEPKPLASGASGKWVPRWKQQQNQ
jgi:translation initiation factor 3 subunit A